MKKVLLIGDSIRMGYCSFVKERLQGKAEVFYADDNARFLQYTLRTVSDWKNNNNWPADMDVVHWNNGLWDLLHMSSAAAKDGEAEGTTAVVGDGVGNVVYDPDPLTPPEMYRYMLQRVHTRIRQLFPKAEIVFATTTPVQKEYAGLGHRSNAEIAAYNQIVRATLLPLGVRINDLHAFAQSACAGCYRDWVHYNEEGCKLLAQEIEEYLTRESLL